LTKNDQTIGLDDKYTQRNGRVFISGFQALVLLPLLQRELDQREGLDTAGFISGYRGSPIGRYDAALWQAQAYLDDYGIIFQPGVNEDLAATAVWGTQQLNVLPNPSVDGVFSIWYGKGPGVDRSGDAMKHGNYAGTHPNGGVLVVYGDDHPGKSSTIAHQSDLALAANSIPSLYPASVQEYIEFGLLGWALSRYAGVWVGFKTVNETIEQTATIEIAMDDFEVALPDRGDTPRDALYILDGSFPLPLKTETDIVRHRLPLVHRFVRANGIDRVTLDSPNRALGNFTETGHVFQNLGDGTYFHSGLLAIRAAVAAGSNITFKILYNDAVAMTGGQPVDGPISVGRISHQVLHEGVSSCVVVTDDPARYGRDSDLAPGVEVFHRDRLDMVQRRLRENPGCTVLIYEQTCAAENRRRRKRGLAPDPARRVFINTDVCEGCGDCSEQSNCVSVLPVETADGQKRRIDQSSCNKDYSCVMGSCPSFVTVYGGSLRTPETPELEGGLFEGLPTPAKAPIDDAYGVMIAGIGGTGVITVGALLGMAAHLEGKGCSVYDMTGLSQKNGAVYSHLKFADRPDRIGSPRLGPGDADLLIGLDLVATLGKESIQTAAADHTHIIGNSSVAPTAEFHLNSAKTVDDSLLVRLIRDRVGDERADFVDATGLALVLIGDTIGVNLFVVGYAAQKGLLPVAVESIEKAVELNGVAVPMNLRAMNLGRLYAHDPTRLEARLDSRAGPESPPTTLEDARDRGVALLTTYQNDSYATRFDSTVDEVAATEDTVIPGSETLAAAVARNLARLMAYKDEYEVARLYTEPTFMARLNEEFEGDFKIKINLAPPLTARRHPDTGLPVKREYGGWVRGVFDILRRLKGLRGTAFDIFGYTAERRLERRLIEDYEELTRTLIDGLTPENHAVAVELAELAWEIRGFGHVKEGAIEQVKRREQELLAEFHRCSSTVQEARADAS
jgi:TPP-dependent indolepyruvate ferredoxin oxidoreductase alpha subunit/Pyruvate/2-oxoacid:ferredoxin oxidoreductase gamma subunit